MNMIHRNGENGELRQIFLKKCCLIVYPEDMQPLLDLGAVAVVLYVQLRSNLMSW